MTPPDLPVTLEKLLAHRAWVRAVARSLVADENDADDVEQQTWALALARPPRHGDSMRGWLGAVARNVARKMGRGRARRKRREAQHASERATSTAPATADLVAEAELQQRIGRAVLELDEPYRETVLLRYFEGLAPRDVAERLGVPVETVRTRLRRAHERLSERLDEQSGGRRGAWAFAVLTWDATPDATTPNATAACATTTCGTVAAVVGGAWMLKKAVIAAAVLVLVAAGVWVAAERRSRVAPAPGEPEVAGAAQPAREQPSLGRRASAEASRDPLADASSEEAIPAPVDLDAADRDRDLHGVVVDASGLPVPGARLTTVTYPWRATGLLSGDYYAVREGPQTRSAPDGTFSLRLARGTSVALRVAAEGLAPVEIPSCLAGARVRVVLRPAVRLVVALRDEHGQPVAGAPVRVFNNDRDGGFVISERVVSGTDGTCEFPNLSPEGWGWIAAEPPLGNCGWEDFLLPVSGELRKEIRVPTGRTLTGRVVDVATGEGVAAARVGMNWTLHMEVWTAADGSFALPGWTGIGIEDVHVRAEGYAADSVVVGDQERLEFRLERGFAAAGRVVGCDGAVIAGALVGLIASEKFSDRVQRTSDAISETDSTGAFGMTGLRRGMRHALVVVAPGNARLRRTVPQPPEGADLDLGEVRLAPPLRLEGMVLDADGSPLPRVDVTVVGPQLEEKQPGEVRYGDEVSGFTDDLGRFRFTDLAAGPYRVTVRCPGGAGAASDVTLPGRDVTDLVIRRGATREVTVRVVDDEGASVAGVDVYVYGDDDEPPFGRTDARGEVRLQVPPANREVAVFLTEHHGDLLHDGTVVELEPDQTEATFRVTRSASLSGTVLDPDGAPVASAHVLVERADETWSLAVSGADGRFSTRVPRSGRVNVAFHGVAAREQGEVDLGIAGRVDGVAPGADVVLRCERIASDRQLTVLVRAPSGDPVAGALVHVNGPVAQVAAGRTDARGRAAFEDLPARPLGVSVAGLSAPTATVFLPPLPVRLTPAGQEAVLTCRAAVPLRGIALDADGRPARGHVRCLLDGEFVSTAPLDADGRFAVLAPADEPGPFRVELLIGPDTVAAAADGVRPGGPDVRLVVPGK